MINPSPNPVIPTSVELTSYLVDPAYVSRNSFVEHTGVKSVKTVDDLV